MKVLIPVHYFLPRHIAGTEIYTFELARELKRRNIDVTIFTKEDVEARDTFYEEDEEISGVKIHRLYMSSPVTPLRRFMGGIFNKKVENAFERLLQREKFDIVHIQHLQGLSLKLPRISKKYNTGLTVTLNDFFYLCDKIKLLDSGMNICSGPARGIRCIRCVSGKAPFLKVAALPLTTFRFHAAINALKCADILIAPSKFIKDIYVKNGICSKKIFHEDYGTDTSSLKKSEDKPFSAKATHALRIGYIGSIIPSKGVHLLLEAFSELKLELLKCDIGLDIWGSLDAEPEYAKSILKNNVSGSAVFHGEIQREHLYSAFKSMDVLAVPSIWAENSPLVIHEAFACGVPVLVSRTGGMCELVEDKKGGLFFNTGDKEDLKANLRKLIEEPHLIISLKNTIPDVKDIKNHVEIILSVYESICSQI